MRRGCVLSLMVVAMLAAGLAPNRAQDAAPEPASIVEPALAQQLERRAGAKVPVLVLLQEQLLEENGGYAKWAKDHAQDKRSDMRAEAVRQMKALSDASRKAVAQRVQELEDSGNLERARFAWIVNALACTADETAVNAMAQWKEVKYLYFHRDKTAAAPGDNALDVSALERDQTDAFELGDNATQFNVEKTGADKAWAEFNAWGQGVVVCLSDGGLYVHAPGIAPSVWINEKETPGNGKDDDGNGCIDDLAGYNFSKNTPDIVPRGKVQLEAQHGTICAGIIAGRPVDGIAVGLAPRSRIMTTVGGFPFDLEYAIENGADVLTMSFSIPNLGDYRGAWRRAMEHLCCAGVFPVSGAGNFGDGSHQRQPLPVQLRVPEDIHCVLAIGGVTEGLKHWPVSSCGPVQWNNVRFYEFDTEYPPGLVKPDVCAFPKGYKMLVDDGFSKIPNLQGNSYSGPHGAGVAALVLSVNPDVKPWEMLQLLQDTAVDLGEKGKDNEFGAGLLDAYAACKQAVEMEK